VNIVILGLSITSSWGNGHATTYRSLIRGLASRGHNVLFLERDVPWYAGNRDEPQPAGTRTELYQSIDELTSTYEKAVTKADLVIVGSFVPDGVLAGNWVTSLASGLTAFYDIDTPVTLEKLNAGTSDYIAPDLIRRYNIYLSFTGGPVLKQIESRFGSPMCRALYSSVDPQKDFPQASQEKTRNPKWDLGYLGTYSEDRQPGLDQLMLEPARRLPTGNFSVAGSLYPETIAWPPNVERTIHLSPREHPTFYGSQRFTLNITRDAMKQAGYSPSVRLFEASACEVPIISDWWAGLDTILEPGHEILISTGTEDTLRYLRDYSETQRLCIAGAARRRILSQHTPERRATQLEQYFKEAQAQQRKAVHA
jgi:spore maturation protein CgeB